MADADAYDEFGNYIGPELDDDEEDEEDEVAGQDKARASRRLRD